MGKEVSTVTLSIVRLAELGSASLTGTERYLAMWKALFSPAVLILRWKKSNNKKVISRSSLAFHCFEVLRI